MQTDPIAPYYTVIVQHTHKSITMLHLVCNKNMMGHYIYFHHNTQMKVMKNKKNIYVLFNNFCCFKANCAWVLVFLSFVPWNPPAPTLINRPSVSWTALGTHLLLIDRFTQLKQTSILICGGSVINGGYPVKFLHVGRVWVTIKSFFLANMWW